MDATVFPIGLRAVRMTPSDHLDSGLMACYLENACEGEERDRIEAHLAECTECCQELVDLDQTIRTMPARTRGRVAIPLVVLGAAAALAGLYVLRSDDTGRVLPEGPPIVQRSQPEDRTTIGIIGPESGAVVEAGEVVLRWEPLEPDARYLVTVTTADGDSVWALMTPDSAAAIPVALEPGGEYLWYVDALLPGGEAAASEIHHFQVPR